MWYQFPRYKILPYHTVSKTVWAIMKRYCLFFYKPLTHTKFVDRTNWIRHYTRSNEILMFATEEKAEDEIDLLDFGHSPIKSRSYFNGELIEEKREE